MRGGGGSDLLDGGSGNDKLYGDSGVDLVFYGGSTKVTVDLSLATDKATRGSETDTLFNIEGAIGSNAGDSFKGNEFNNFFQGGRGKDTVTGGGGRDLHDFNATAESGTSSTTRDLIKDFAHLTDKIDVTGIDADSTTAGNQAFHWVGTAFTGAAGELGFFTSGGNTIIQASNDADTAADFQIQLTGIKTDPHRRRFLSVAASIAAPVRCRDRAESRRRRLAGRDWHGVGGRRRDDRLLRHARQLDRRLRRQLGVGRRG